MLMDFDPRFRNPLFSTHTRKVVSFLGFLGKTSSAAVRIYIEGTKNKKRASRFDLTRVFLFVLYG